MTRTAWLIFACWMSVCIAVAFLRPLMPADETRYMSVAWEMLIQHHWILPTLNFEPYSQKPPLLFWLIRFGWEIFGVGLAGPRVLIGLYVLALFWLTHRLARALVPDNKKIPGMAILLLAALPVFITYASTLMFDTLLALFVVAGMLATKYAADGKRHAWLMLGAALGLAMLTKGPVALVHILPCALLAPLWTDIPHKKRWYGHLALAVLMGAAMILAWAIPAALEGGSAYTQKIFVTQSMGRMANAFDHREPFWYYAPVLAGFLLPLLALPALWRKPVEHKGTLRFLACWIVPTILFFSLISSKSIHYVVPLMPAFAIMGALALREEKLRWAIAPVLLLAVPSLVLLINPAPIVARIFDFYPLLAWGHIALSLVLACWIWRKPAHGLQVMAVAAALLVVVAHGQLSRAFLPRFDLAQSQSAIAPYLNHSIAIAPKYDGEYGYAFGLRNPVDSIGSEEAELIAWFKKHPDGIIITRYNKPENIPQRFKILYRQNYRQDDVLLFLAR